MIWAAGNDSCASPTGANVSCLRFIQVSTAGANPTLLQDKDLAVSGTELFDPAVTLDGHDNLFVGFSTSSSTLFGSADALVIPGGYVTANAGMTVMAQGTSPFVDGAGTSSIPYARWGDYSGAAPDPTNPQAVWLAAEYTVNADGSANPSPDWVTQIGAFSFTTTAVTGLSPASAPELSASCSPMVTISGANFDSSVQVTFGTVASPQVTVLSPTQLQAQVPSQARGVVDVTVTTTSGGTSATSSADQFTYTADTTPPVTTATLAPAPNASGWEHSAVQVTLAATDGTCGSGIKATSYTLDGATQTYSGPFSIQTAGHHTITYSSTDTAGNTETAHQVLIPIDLTPPHTTATLSGTPAGTSYLPPVTVTLSATDPTLADGSAGSGVAATRYALDGGAFQTYSGPVHISTAGKHTLTYASTDKAGNAEITGTTSFTVVNSIFTTQTPAATYSGAYELGVKFQSTQAGYIDGLRYYKPANETGTHTGHLWSASGTLLGTVTFTGESASGWQSALFTTPIAISANTTYVGSVNSNTALAYTSSGLSTAVSNGPLATVADGKNGVYSTTRDAFPTIGTAGTNYFR
ncbi:MAG TPA: DUF4082 domain-containing protein, partial [Chloroflexota bacterium]|nr:DUF4082 domain-containing protein [Chloroflexota bacterium]